MKRGHVTGTRWERQGSQEWYQAIEAAHLARIEAAWAAKALPEAPASANVRVQSQGRECQITLRDTDEARLLVRLQTFLE